MKKKHTGLIICLIFAALVIVGILAAVLHKNADRETGTLTGTPAPTMTIAPTKEAAPTVEPTATEVPTPTVTAAPTNTPTLTPTAEPIVTQAVTPVPTSTPTPTPEPTATSTPTPEPSPTPTATPEPSPTPTATPEPTATPTPTPEPTPVLVNKKNGEVISVAKTVKLNEGSYVYVYENGDVQLVNNNTGYAEVYRAGVSTDISTTDLVAKMTEMDKSFGEDFISKMNVASSCMPTPTPTPTPFPTPNPEQPKKLASYKGDKDYGDVTVEAWDNGYMYIKGTGTFYKYTSMDYHPQDLMNYLDIVKASGCDAYHICIEEGITQLNKRPAWSGTGEALQNAVRYIDFPPSFYAIKKAAMVDTFTNDVTITGYEDGKKVTFILKAGDNLYDALKKNLNIEIK